MNEATRLGLSGVCLTEHSGGWEQPEFDQAFEDAGLAVIRGLEVDTDMGHILVFGMHRYVAGMHKASELRKAVDNAGGVMISAHPFRNFFNRPPYNTNLLFPKGRQIPESASDAANHPLFNLVDDIEAGKQLCLRCRDSPGISRHRGQRCSFRARPGQGSHNFQP